MNFGYKCNLNQTKKKNLSKAQNQIQREKQAKERRVINGQHRQMYLTARKRTSKNQNSYKEGKILLQHKNITTTLNEISSVESIHQMLTCMKRKEIEKCHVIFVYHIIVFA
ncbi:hypothetical protein ACJX0J_035758 [Zea mays]